MINYNFNNIHRFSPLLMVCLVCLIVALIAILPDLAAAFNNKAGLPFMGYCDGSGGPLLQGVDGSVHSGPGGAIGFGWIHSLWSSAYSACETVGSWLYQTTNAGLASLSSIIGAVGKWGSAAAAKIYNVGVSLSLPSIFRSPFAISELIAYKAINEWFPFLILDQRILLGAFAFLKFFPWCVILAVIVELTHLSYYVYYKVCLAYWTTMAFIFSHPVLYQLLYCFSNVSAIRIRRSSYAMY